MESAAEGTGLVERDQSKRLTDARLWCSRCNYAPTGVEIVVLTNPKKVNTIQIASRTESSGNSNVVPGAKSS